MKRLVAAALTLLLGSCSPKGDRTELVLQRFFGECGAVYGQSVDVAKAETECGILTTIINRFEAENPDIRVSVNIVAWPGYPQLSAQIAGGKPPDLVTMHQSVIADYQGRGLLDPMDGVLATAGLRADDFTEATRAGVTKAGKIWGLPLDTVGRLFHINTRLMAQAGLMKDGRPVLPTSADELLSQGRQFVARTGKPYLLMGQVNAPDTHVGNFYTYVLAQGGKPFPAPGRARLDTAEGRRVVELFKQINAQGLTKSEQDFPAANTAFINGEGGIMLTGTWMIGPYDEVAQSPSQGLYRSYAVQPYPRLFGRETAFVDGHAWVMPKHARDPHKLRAAARFLAFMAKQNFHWARTGHLPAMAAVLKQAEFRALPHRADIARMAQTGRQLPDYVQRQSAVQGLIGEELESAVNGSKPIPQALADAERRVNELFSQIL